MGCRGEKPGFVCILKADHGEGPKLGAGGTRDDRINVQQVRSIDELGEDKGDGLHTGICLGTDQGNVI